MKKLMQVAILFIIVVGLTVVPTHAQTPKVTLSLIASQNWVPDSEQTLAKKFEDKTGIHVDFQIIPADQYFTVLQTKLNSGQGPDIFLGQSGKTDLVVNYNVAKNAVDLSDMAWVKQEDPLVADQATVGGKVYGLTIFDVVGTTWVINYNKAIFQKNNLTPPTTYAEFKTLCQTLLKAGITPIYEPAADGWHHVLWFPELGPRYEEVTPGLGDQLNANKTTLVANPTMLTDLTQLKEMYDAGFFGANTLADKFADGTKMMASGKYAMMLNNLTFAQSVEKDNPDFKADNIGVFVMPLADNQLLNLNPAGPSMFIYSGSQHIAEAKQYFDFLTQSDSLQAMLDNPAPNTWKALPFTGVKSSLLDSQQKFLDDHAKSRGVVLQTAVTYVNPQWIDIGKDITAMFTGAMQPNDVLTSIDKRRADLAKTAKDPAWTK
ncbi:MAG: ABC transporter substrate-binding protein [Chloroflexota bacterium]